MTSGGVFILQTNNENLENKIYDNAHEIIPGLWLGNIEASEDEIFMNINNIKFVINATNDIPCKFREIDYYRVSVDDPGPWLNMENEDNQIMLKEFPYLMIYLRHHLTNKHNVLVHCYAGVQRSAIIVLLYLMLYVYNGTKEERFKLAYVHLMRKRPYVFNNGSQIHFKPALIEYLKNKDLTKK